MNQGQPLAPVAADLARLGPLAPQLLPQLQPADALALAHFGRCLLLSVPDYDLSRPAYLALLKDSGRPRAFALLAGLLNAACRQAGGAGDTVARTQAWQNLVLSLQAMQAHLQALLHSAGLMWSAPVALPPVVAEESEVQRGLLPSLPDGDFVHLVVEAMLGRGCHPPEWTHWCERLAGHGPAGRKAMVRAVFSQMQLQQQEDAARGQTSAAVFHVMGTGQRVSLADWSARAHSLLREPAGPSAVTRAPAVSPGPVPVVTAIASMYKAGEYIEPFLHNLVGQQGFDRCELLIIDACSPDGEADTIARFAQHHPNIRHHRLDHRAGIYEAWNLAVSLARGQYLTSTNLDDLRRADSLMLQAQALERFPEVDVVYQDFFYTLDPTLGFEDIARFGYRSQLPEVTAQTLLQLNPPHNAPMWRRRLHDELGLFDTSLHTAADYDFWMRCVLAHKRFLKLEPVHVAYYQNPQGLSTRPDGRGHQETRLVHQRYMRQLLAMGSGLGQGGRKAGGTAHAFGGANLAI